MGRPSFIYSWERKVGGTQRRTDVFVCVVKVATVHRAPYNPTVM
jgi:hypothetical protein